MFLKPALGLKVRHPVTKRHIPDNGIEVSDSPYWARRLACGDVVLSKTNMLPVNDVSDSVSEGE